MFIKYSEVKIVDNDLDLEKISKFIDKNKKIKTSEKSKNKSVKSEK